MYVIPQMKKELDKEKMDTQEKEEEERVRKKERGERMKGKKVEREEGKEKRKEEKDRETKQDVDCRNGEEERMKRRTLVDQGRQHVRYMHLYLLTSRSSDYMYNGMIQ